MDVSVFELFSVGIGPSSSHTVGPMRAARRFAVRLQNKGLLHKTHRVLCEMYGSLGWTGKGHGTDKAVLMGLEGEQPELVDPEGIPSRCATIATEGTLSLLGLQPIPFSTKADLVFDRKTTLPKHPNGMRFTAWDASGQEIQTRLYYSVGGGFIIPGTVDSDEPVFHEEWERPYPFTTAEQMLRFCRITGKRISDLMMANETVTRSEEEVRGALLHIWSVMRDAIHRGCKRQGILPGGLKVERRAATLSASLESHLASAADPLAILDQVNLWALAVSEENAAGGRVVTAPTNGAAGIIPAVLQHYCRHHADASEDGVIRFLLTAGAIGILYKINASLSGAEVGCQGEVGVACSMAAAGLAEALGGTPEQVENAAEIGMEHNLGLTCDPVGGLVQVPCIERNAMGSIKAINAARLALRGDGRHKVPLDKVIRTMKATGADMQSKYKETSRGGLAVHLIEC